MVYRDFGSFRPYETIIYILVFDTMLEIVWIVVDCGQGSGVRGEQVELVGVVRRMNPYQRTHWHLFAILSLPNTILDSNGVLVPYSTVHVLGYLEALSNSF